ncbi:MAG: HAD-IIIA family hydrolase [Bacilli bacterium]|nr:HAD-IIIA family hydrolase [Bacilli bacterium]
MKPDAYYKDIYEIDYKELKDLGIKNIFFDVDNTIIPYTEDKVTEDNIKLFNELKKDFNLVIVSNSNSHRINSIIEDLGITGYTSSMKPLNRTYKKIKKIYNTNESIFIGDQFMTDVWGAHKNDFKVILVDRIGNKEPLTTKFWRTLESFVRRKLTKDGFQNGNYYKLKK